MSILRPDDAEQVAEAVAWAASTGTPLEIVGAGTRRGVGRPLQVDDTLDLSGLTGITLYEPDELVLSARAGTPLAEIAATLAAHGQELAFEPPDLGPLLGTPAGGSTIGGVVAANLSGPRRIKAGAVRDHFLGVTAVSGRGETFRSGGRVVKNVTGYDLCKAVAGSWGTLAVMTDVIVKVLPAAETEATILLAGLDDEAAMAAMSAALGSSCEVSGAAHLPGAIAARSAVDSVAAAAASVTAIRLEGIPASVDYRADKLKSLLGERGDIVVLGAAPSKSLWCEIRDVGYFAETPERPVWRLSVPPMSGARAVAAIDGGGTLPAFYDWGGGLVWLAPDPSDDAMAATIRDAVASTGGHATLLRAPEAMRAAVPVFQPQATDLAALTRRIKQGFDPAGVLNPGRMYAGV